MASRGRVLAAIGFQAPDIMLLEIPPSRAGLLGHGLKLLGLMHRAGHDFGDTSEFALPTPPEPGDWDPDGCYHSFRTDECGTAWEQRLFGVWGCRIHYPLADLAALPAHGAPAPPALRGQGTEAAQQQAARHRERCFLVGDGANPKTIPIMRGPSQASAGPVSACKPLPGRLRHAQRVCRDHVQLGACPLAYLTRSVCCASRVQSASAAIIAQRQPPWRVRRAGSWPSSICGNSGTADGESGVSGRRDPASTPPRRPSRVRSIPRGRGACAGSRLPSATLERARSTAVRGGGGVSHSGDALPPEVVA